MAKGQPEHHNWGNLKEKEFVEKLTDLLSDNRDRRILVRGYFNQDKLTAVLRSLNKSVKTSIGKFVVSSIGEVPSLFKGSFSSGKFHKVNQSDTYEVVGLKLSFEKRNKIKNHNYSYNEDFVVFFPVESLLYIEKDTDIFISQLKNQNTAKVIAVTTNDYSRKAEKLYPYVSDVLILDTSDENIDTYEILKGNMKSEGKEMPY